MDISNLGEQGLAHVIGILHAQGELRFFKDWDKDLTDRLKAAVIRPGSEPVIRRVDPVRHTEQAYRLVVSQVAATRARRFDYNRLLSDSPKLYAQYVRITPPSSPVVVTFPKATDWQELRSEGWQAAAARWQAVRAASLANIHTQAEALSDVRERARATGETEAVERIGLGGMLAARGPVAYTYRHSVMRVTEAKERQSVDFDIVEQHPQLRQYVAYSDRSSFTKVWFQKADDEL